MIKGTLTINSNQAYALSLLLACVSDGIVDLYEDLTWDDPDFDYNGWIATLESVEKLLDKTYTEIIREEYRRKEKYRQNAVMRKKNN